MPSNSRYNKYKNTVNSDMTLVMNAMILTMLEEDDSEDLTYDIIREIISEFTKTNPSLSFSCYLYLVGFASVYCTGYIESIDYAFGQKCSISAKNWPIIKLYTVQEVQKLANYELSIIIENS